MATPTLLQEAATLVDTSFDELPILYAVLSLASACVNSPAFLYVDSHFIGWPIPSATSRSLMRSSWALFARPALSRDSSTVSRWAAFSLSLCTPHPCAPPIANGSLIGLAPAAGSVLYAVKNHSVSESVVDETFAHAERFFKSLTDEEKMEVGPPTERARLTRT